MSPEDIKQIQLLQQINNMKIERLEIAINKQKRILNEEIAILEEIKKNC